MGELWKAVGTVITTALSKLNRIAAKARSPDGDGFLDAHTLPPPHAVEGA